ncbi:MAG: hypothetical protein NW202_08630 [Nitrospira sp.]|nr:hypothetical protein [Nitrospira sp.]
MVARLSMLHRRLSMSPWNLTASEACRYAAGMTKLATVLVAACLACMLPGRVAAGKVDSADGIPAEDYGLYDQVVEQKFLTSQTKLVLLERTTVSRIFPDQTEPMTEGLLEAQTYFRGQLPTDLVRDFVRANRIASRLDARFQFGVRYRFLSAGSIEEPEVALAVPVQVPPVLDRLAFSRVGRTLRNDQALLYVENLRPDGTGAGLLVWFHRQAHTWILVDTEVVWTLRDRHGDAEDP